MRLKYLILAFLCHNITIAQNYWGEITYPVYGSVMQGNTATSNTIDVTFQVQNRSTIDWRLTLLQFDWTAPGAFNLTYPSAFYDKALNDPTLGFVAKDVSGNISFSTIKGKLNGLAKKQYIMYLHVGNFNPFSAFFAGTPCVFGIGDVYFIAGQSNAAAYNVSARTLWEDPLNISNRRGLHDFSSTDDATVPFLPNTPTSGFEFSRTMNFNGRFDFWASVFDNTTLPLNSQLRIDYNLLSRRYNELSPPNGNWFGIPYGGKYERLRHGTDKVNDPMHIFPNGQASWYWASLGHKITKENGVPTLFFNVAVPGTSLI